MYTGLKALSLSIQRQDQKTYMYNHMEQPL